MASVTITSLTIACLSAISAADQKTKYIVRSEREPQGHEREVGTRLKLKREPGRREGVDPQGPRMGSLCKVNATYTRP